MGFTVPWVSLCLEERWSLTPGSLSDGFYCTMGVIMFRREVVSDISSLSDRFYCAIGVIIFRREVVSDL